AAVSGIDANQTMLDEIGNNIANADTVGYKAGQVQFGYLLSEQIAGATAPTGRAGGTNPVAVGSGVLVTSVGTDLTEGSLESTGNPNDVAIQGSGYLIVDKNGQQLYTRDGALTPDAAGNLTVDGGLVMGWAANAAGVIDTNTPLTPVAIPTGQTIGASATTELTLGGNLPAWNGVGTPPTVTVTTFAYDSLGAVVPVTLTFTGVPGQADQWTLQGTVPDPAGGADHHLRPHHRGDLGHHRVHGRTGRVAARGGGCHASGLRLPGRGHLVDRLPGRRFDRGGDPVRQPADPGGRRAGRLPGGGARGVLHRDRRGDHRDVLQRADPGDRPTGDGRLRQPRGPDGPGRGVVRHHRQLRPGPDRGGRDGGARLPARGAAGAVERGPRDGADRPDHRPGGLRGEHQGGHHDGAGRAGPGDDELTVGAQSAAPMFGAQAPAPMC